MRKQLLAVSILVTGVLGSSTVLAHNPGHSGGSYGGWSGNVSVWGAPHGTGYAGNIGYSTGYAPVPPYAGAYFYPACNHWHPRGYKAPKRHGYGKAYAHGYVDGYQGGHDVYQYKHHKRKHGHGHGKGHHH
jgi:hypothetical protein